jgi:hypothetical protein
MTKPLVTGVDFVTVPARDLGQEFRSHGLPIALQVDDVDAARAELDGEAIHHRYPKD